MTRKEKCKVINRQYEELGYEKRFHWWELQFDEPVQSHATIGDYKFTEEEYESLTDKEKYLLERSIIEKDWKAEGIPAWADEVGESYEYLSSGYRYATWMG